MVIFTNDKSYLDHLLATDGDGLTDAATAVYRLWRASIAATQAAAEAIKKVEDQLHAARKAVDINLGRCQGQAQVLAAMAREDGSIVDSVEGPEELAELLGATIDEIKPVGKEAS